MTLRIHTFRDELGTGERLVLDSTMDAMLNALSHGELELEQGSPTQQLHNFPGDDSLADVEHTIARYIIEARTGT